MDESFCCSDVLRIPRGLSSMMKDVVGDVLVTGGCSKWTKSVVGLKRKANLTFPLSL